MENYKLLGDAFLKVFTVEFVLKNKKYRIIY